MQNLNSTESEKKIFQKLVKWSRMFFFFLTFQGKTFNPLYITNL